MKDGLEKRKKEEPRQAISDHESTRAEPLLKSTPGGAFRMDEQNKAPLKPLEQHIAETYPDASTKNKLAKLYKRYPKHDAKIAREQQERNAKQIGEKPPEED
jgi:hypothetical protein